MGRSQFFFPEPKPAGGLGCQKSFPARWEAHDQLTRPWGCAGRHVPPMASCSLPPLRCCQLLGCRLGHAEEQACLWPGTHSPRTPQAARRCPQPPAPWQQLPAALLVCLPAHVPHALPPALLFLHFFFFLLLFYSLPVTVQGGRRGASSEWAARGDGRRGVIGLESSGCSPHCHSRFQRSHFLPSPGSLFLPTKEERTVSTAAAVPQIASQSCCPEQRSAAECYAILSLPLLGPPGRVVALRAGLSGSGIGVSGKLSRRLCKAWCWLVVCLSFFLSLTFPPKKLSS